LWALITLTRMITVVSVTDCTIKGRSFRYTLISRRSCHRAGTRYNIRGIDTDGQIANFIETEQIVEYGNSRCSYVQVCDSINGWLHYTSIVCLVCCYCIVCRHLAWCVWILFVYCASFISKASFGGPARCGVTTAKTASWTHLVVQTCTFYFVCVAFMVYLVRVKVRAEVFIKSIQKTYIYAHIAVKL